MNASVAKTLTPSVSIGLAADMFLGPVAIALVLLFSLLLPLRQAHGQTSPAIDYQYQRAMSRIVAGSAAGLQVKQPGTINIINGGRLIGSIALQEKRVIDLATLARYARASTVPTVLALGAVELVKYGLEKCADGSWCKSATGEQAPNGKPYNPERWYVYHTTASTSAYTSSVDEACAGEVGYFAGAFGRQYVYRSSRPVSGFNQVMCIYDWVDANPPRYGLEQPVNFGSGCVAGAQLVNGMCVPPGYVPGTQPTPATSVQVEDAWKQAFQTNPFIQEQYWGFEDQTANNEAWAKALQQTAEIMQPDTVTDARPMETTTKDGQTTKKQTTCTYAASPNSDPVTKLYSPGAITERCVTTTTHPDGTQTTETTEKAATPAGGSETRVPPEVKVETCGLPGKPACKIDETGTPTNEGKLAQAETELSAARQAAAQQLQDVSQQSTFSLSLPTLLPGGSCAPITFFKWKEWDGTVDLCDKLWFVRALLSFLWTALTAIYIYNRVSSANA